MSQTLLPTIAEIKEAFAEEIAGAGGTVADTFDDGDRLFIRSILSLVREVRPGDRVQGGVALRVAHECILVHPYVYRQVCRNGAIVAQALKTQRLERVESYAGGGEAPEVLAALREAVQACLAEEVFAGFTEQMRSATEVEADLVLNLMPMLSRLPAETRGRLLADITQRFTAERDRSLFGLMNAVTSLARDTRDPETRWRLEEFGGAIPARLLPAPKPDDAAVALAV
jgi:hypothetical protein